MHHVYHALAMVVLLLATTSFAWAYDYDEDDTTQGAGAEAAWRSVAQWDTVDEIGTRAIHEFTTEARYMTPLVSYIPESDVVPSPRDILGYIAGAEGRLTHPDDELRYFEALSAASPRVQLLEMGTTEEGRVMSLVVISSVDNLARLEEFKAYNAKLADPRKTNDTEAAAMIADMKPMMYITAGLHAPETGPPEMVMELAYRLAVSNHPDIESIRDNVVSLITPITEVDGRARTVEWYRRHAEDYDTRFYTPGVRPPYWGEYAYHDNNRDGIQMTLKLTQNYVRAYYEWLPVYSLDLHESVPLLYVAGGTGPYNRNIDPITIREWQLIAHWELAELQRQGLPGVWTWAFYTGWNPSYLLWVTNNHNSIGRFYETFGNSTAQTIDRDLTDREYAGKKVTTQQWYRTEPPDEDVRWSLRNNTNYMQSGVLSSLTFTARNGAMLLDNYYRKGKNAIERGKEDKPYGWVIPVKQRSRDRLAYLINQLQKHKVEVHRASDDFEIDEGEFEAGDFVVKLDQPYGPLAKNLLAIQMFPEDADHRPYDDVSWSLGHLYRIETTPIKDKALFEVEGLKRLDAPIILPGTLSQGRAAAYLIKNEGANTMVSLRYRLRRDNVLAAEAAFEVDDESYPAGSWLIPHQRGIEERLKEAATDFGLVIHTLEEMPDVAAHALDVPRLALYHNWVSTQDDGWVRYTFEQAGVPFEYINDDDIRGGALRNQYDVIMMAHQGGTGAKRLVHGRDPKFGALAWTSTRQYPSHGVIDSSRDITGGMGFKGLGNLEAFLDDGGTLLLLGSSGRLATDMGLVRNVSAGGEVNTPGSVLTVKLSRPDHPIGYGYEETNHVFRTNAPVYSVSEEFDHWIVVQYGTEPLRDDDDEDDEEDSKGEGADDAEDEDGDEDGDGDGDGDGEEKLLLAGYLSPKDGLDKKGVILDIPRNAGGRVILYSFNPMHRYLNHGDHNYVYNAILNWNDFPEPTPLDHPELAKD